MTKFEVVKGEIDDWDPLDLLAIAPKDEYDPEISAIANELSEAMSVDQIAILIQSVFIKYFGQTFDRNLEECRQVAEKIHFKLTQGLV